MYIIGYPGASVVKNLPANAGDAGSIPGSGRSPAEGNGNSSVLAWEIPCTLVFLPGKYYVQMTLVGYSPWNHRRVG